MKLDFTPCKRVSGSDPSSTLTDFNSLVYLSSFAWLVSSPFHIFSPLLRNFVSVIRQPNLFLVGLVTFPQNQFFPHMFQSCRYCLLDTQFHIRTSLRSLWYSCQLHLWISNDFQDNRHYVFYIWKNVFRSRTWPR